MVGEGVEPDAVAGAAEAVAFGGGEETAGGACFGVVVAGGPVNGGV